MKQIFTCFLFVVLTYRVAAQVPKLINYQGKAQSASGKTFTSNISVRFEILQGSPGGTVVFTEDHLNLPVSAEGLFSTQIGKLNTLPSGWDQGPYFLRVGIDTTAGSTFVTLSNPQQLASVPFALNAPPPAVSFTNNVLTVGTNTALIPPPAVSVSNNIITVGTNTAQLPAQGGLQTLNVSGNTLGISGGNTVTLPSSGSVSVSEYKLFGALIGIGQVLGTYPNYTVVVSPDISYNQATGLLTLKDVPSIGGSAYNVNYNITPNLNLTNGLLTSGPSTNVANFNPYTPWRTAAAGSATLANSTGSVGIGVNSPTAALHVDGFTKLGSGSPRLQVVKITTVTPATASGTVTVPLPSVTSQGSPLGQVSASQVLSVQMVADPTGPLDCIGASNTSLGMEFHWQITGSNLLIYTTAANSGSVLNVPVRILVTVEQ